MTTPRPTTTAQPARPASAIPAAPVGGQTTSDLAPTNDGVTGPIAVPGVPQTPNVPSVPGATGAVPVSSIIPRVAPSTPTQGPGTTSAVPVGTGPITEYAPPTGTAGGSGPTLTPTDPNNPLTGQTIAPGINDRYAIAKQRFDQFVEGSDPAYKAALTNANRMGAAQGRLGSGSLRTDFGNLANQRDLNLRTAERGFLTDALEGEIGDSRFATGVAQQQQGFQSEQQQRAFENELRRLGFDDDLINSAFGRALGTFNAGNVGGTGSGTVLTGAGQAQGDANASNDALAELIRLITQNRAQGGTGGVAP